MPKAHSSRVHPRNVGGRKDGMCSTLTVDRRAELTGSPAVLITAPGGELTWQPTKLITAAAKDYSLAVPSLRRRTGSLAACSSPRRHGDTKPGCAHHRAGRRSHWQPLAVLSSPCWRRAHCWLCPSPPEWRADRYLAVPSELVVLLRSNVGEKPAG
jgi:hypothetical protein